MLRSRPRIVPHRTAFPFRGSSTDDIDSGSGSSVVGSDSTLFRPPPPVYTSQARTDSPDATTSTPPPEPYSYNAPPQIWATPHRNSGSETPPVPYSATLDSDAPPASPGTTLPLRVKKAPSSSPSPETPLSSGQDREKEDTSTSESFYSYRESAAVVVPTNPAPPSQPGATRPSSFRHSTSSIPGTVPSPTDTSNPNNATPPKRPSKRHRYGSGGSATSGTSAGSTNSLSGGGAGGGGGGGGSGGNNQGAQSGPGGTNVGYHQRTSTPYRIYREPSPPPPLPARPPSIQSSPVGAGAATNARTPVSVGGAPTASMVGVQNSSAANLGTSMHGVHGGGGASGNGTFTTTTTTTTTTTPNLKTTRPLSSAVQSNNGIPPNVDGAINATPATPATTTKSPLTPPGLTSTDSTSTHTSTITPSSIAALSPNTKPNPHHGVLSSETTRSMTASTTGTTTTLSSARTPASESTTSIASSRDHLASNHRRVDMDLDDDVRDSGLDDDDEDERGLPPFQSNPSLSAAYANPGSTPPLNVLHSRRVSGLPRMDAGNGPGAGVGALLNQEQSSVPQHVAQGPPPSMPVPVPTGPGPAAAAGQDQGLTQAQAQGPTTPLVLPSPRSGSTRRRLSKRRRDGMSTRGGAGGAPAPASAPTPVFVTTNPTSNPQALSNAQTEKDREKEREREREKEKEKEKKTRRSFSTTRSTKDPNPKSASTHALPNAPPSALLSSATNHEVPTNTGGVANVGTGNVTNPNVNATTSTTIQPRPKNATNYVFLSRKITLDPPTTWRILGFKVTRPSSSSSSSSSPSSSGSSTSASITGTFNIDPLLKIPMGLLASLDSGMLGLGGGGGSGGGASGGGGGGGMGMGSGGPGSGAVPYMSASAAASRKSVNETLHHSSAAGGGGGQGAIPLSSSNSGDGDGGVQMLRQNLRLQVENGGIDVTINLLPTLPQATPAIMSGSGSASAPASISQSQSRRQSLAQSRRSLDASMYSSTTPGGKLAGAPGRRESTVPTEKGMMLGMMNQHPGSRRRSSLPSTHYGYAAGAMGQRTSVSMGNAGMNGSQTHLGQHSRNGSYDSVRTGYGYGAVGGRSAAGGGGGTYQERPTLLDLVLIGTRVSGSGKKRKRKDSGDGVKKSKFDLVAKITAPHPRPPFHLFASTIEMNTPEQKVPYKNPSGSTTNLGGRRVPSTLQSSQPIIMPLKKVQFMNKQAKKQAAASGGGSGSGAPTPTAASGTPNGVSAPPAPTTGTSTPPIPGTPPIQPQSQQQYYTPVSRLTSYHRSLSTTSLSTYTSSIHLTLPVTFRGPLTIHVMAGNIDRHVRLSKGFEEKSVVLMEGGGGRVYFVGGLDWESAVGFGHVPPVAAAAEGEEDDGYGYDSEELDGEEGYGDEWVGYEQDVDEDGYLKFSSAEKGPSPAYHAQGLHPVERRRLRKSLNDEKRREMYSIHRQTKTNPASNPRGAGDDQQDSAPVEGQEGEGNREDLSGSETEDDEPVLVSPPRQGHRAREDSGDGEGYVQPEGVVDDEGVDVDGVRVRCVCSVNGQPKVQKCTCGYGSRRVSRHGHPDYTPYGNSNSGGGGMKPMRPPSFASAQAEAQGQRFHSHHHHHPVPPLPHHYHHHRDHHQVPPSPNQLPPLSQPDDDEWRGDRVELILGDGKIFLSFEDEEDPFGEEKGGFWAYFGF